MSRIRRLDPALVNKIAAGEVIERPASVVKELLENALDAGARRLTVELVEGGAALVRVTDDGGGIEPADLPLAVAPHATSKISSADDLFRIGTLGFRGEALASLAAVSRLRIVSRTRDADQGTEIVACDGQVEGPRPCPAPPGTTVEVERLFFNVPARRKFLRQASTELAYVTEQIARLSLGRPDVAVRQIHGGREMRNLPATADRRSRIADFYGPELAADLIPMRRSERGLTIEGLIAPPAAARVTAKWQYTLLNGRYISDRFIKYAIREAYRGLIEPSRHPIVFLFLETGPAEFDVNVHPTKIEVRWRDGGLVQSQVLALLRDTLLSRDLTPAFRTPSTAPPSERAERVRTAIADFLRSAATQHELPLTPSRPSRHEAGAIAGPAGPRWPPLDHSATPPPITPPEPAARDEQPAVPAPGSAFGRRALQVHNTYLVVESAEGLMIVDQHALHERILFEQFSRRILAGPLESQRLLMPETVSVAPEHVAAIDAHSALLAQIGLELSPFGPDCVAVQSFPTLLHRVSPAEFVRELLDRLADRGPAEHAETLVESVLQMMACKAAVKAGDALTGEEIDALLDQRPQVDRHSNCPHGRPTTLSLSIRDLERQFKRT